MCDYCGCRSEPEIARLSEDHEAIGEILGRLRRDGAHDLDRRIDELDAVLLPHSLREEVGLYPQLRRAGIDGDRLDHEHTLIDEAFLAARQQPDLLDTAIELLARHIFEEETDLFPAAHQMLGPDQWDEIDRAVDALSPAAADPARRAHHHHDHHHHGGTR